MADCDGKSKNLVVGSFSAINDATKALLGSTFIPVPGFWKLDLLEIKGYDTLDVHFKIS